MLLAWGNSGSDSSFNVINTVQRHTKYKLRMHKEYVLSVVVLPLHKCIASCSIDRTVAIWPMELIKTREISIVQGSKGDIPTITPNDCELSRPIVYLKGMNDCNLCRVR